MRSERDLPRIVVEKSYEERPLQLIWINMHPRFDGLRGDPPSGPVSITNSSVPAAIAADAYDAGFAGRFVPIIRLRFRLGSD